MQSEELRDLYSSPNIIPIKSSKIRWAGNVPRMEDRGRAYRMFLGKPEGKRPLGWPKPRWENNTKMGLQEAG